MSMFLKIGYSQVAMLKVLEICIQTTFIQEGTSSLSLVREGIFDNHMRLDYHSPTCLECASSRI
jgi:hypothetical protein